MSPGKFISESVNQVWYRQLEDSDSMNFWFGSSWFKEFMWFYRLIFEVFVILDLWNKWTRLIYVEWNMCLSINHGIYIWRIWTRLKQCGFGCDTKETHCFSQRDGLSIQSSRLAWSQLCLQSGPIDTWMKGHKTTSPFWSRYQQCLVLKRKWSFRLSIWLWISFRDRFMFRSVCGEREWDCCPLLTGRQDSYWFGGMY